MKINYYIALTLFLGACTAPTTSINLETTTPSTDGFLFYVDDNINLHSSELLQKIKLPSEDYVVPSILNLLPNAKREYRAGTHEGIDFSIPLNAPVMAVAGGIVVRSNPQHVDVDIDTYNAFLATSAGLNKTPDDIYNYILLGKSVVIDHGYTITSKFRTISVYAHLSSIPEGIVPGAQVEQGTIVGLSGNTGTSDGDLKNDKGAHLHWELHFDSANDRYFLGQNIPPNDLYNNIQLLFNK
ncbi:MAG: M23 family metallopeptidase [Candidatus Neomarinimicrobiota bacterium]|nr:M23 family metallopeptidase [Candidatus Neomarinimicrobiota bacterium]